MKTKKIKKIYARALKIWDIDFQFNHLLEEICELGAAINHYRRGRIGPEELAGEFADVIIKMEIVLESIMHDNFPMLIRKHYYEKLEHLKGLIEEIENKN